MAEVSDLDAENWALPEQIINSDAVFSLCDAMVNWKSLMNKNLAP
jgi:hypothetical protein